MCLVEWCDNKPNPSGKGYCRTHYDQIRKYGTILNTRTKANKNEVIIHNDYAELLLRNSNGDTIAATLIDIEDVERVRAIRWSMNNNGYVRTNKNNKTIYLHRFLLCATDTNKDVDHINRNKLDNRKSNLRLCAHYENAFNRESKNIYGVNGVRKVKRNLTKPWVAVITYNNKSIHLGYYSSLNEAIEARIDAEKELNAFRFDTN